VCSPFDVTCLALTAASSGFEAIAQSVGQAAAEFIGGALTFWITTPSVDPDSDVVRELQGYTMPVVVTMLVASIMVQGIRMTISRKKDPAINVALGLLRFAVINAIGLTTLGLALRAGDALAESLISQGIGDYVERMRGLFAGIGVANPFVLLSTGLLGVILGAVQWLIAIVRMAGILVLAAMMLLSASGGLNESTKGWDPKSWGYSIALVLYKPTAAVIYVTGFKLMGPGQDLTTVATGMAVLALAIVALPVMLKFFSWSSIAVSGGASVGGVLAAGALGAVSLASLRSGGGAASGQSQERSGVGSSPAGAAATPGGGASGGSLWDNPPGAGGTGPAGGGSRTAPGALAAGSSPAGAPGAGTAAGGAAAAAGGAGGGAAGGAAAGASRVAAAAQLAQGANQLARGAAEGMAGPPDEGPPPGMAGGARP
jgi:hypothetical protein